MKTKRAGQEVMAKLPRKIMGSMIVLMVAQVFHIYAGNGLSAMAEERKPSVSTRIDPAFEYQLEQLKNIVHNAREIEVEVMGPANRKKFDKDRSLTKEEQELDNALTKECNGILASIKEGSVKVPKPVASMIVEEDQEPYYELVSGIVRRYQPEYLRLYREHCQKNPQEPNENTTAEEEYQQKVQEHESFFLNRDNYRENPTISTKDIMWKVYHDFILKSRRALFQNGGTDTGEPRYVELLYMMWFREGEPLDYPVRAIELINYNEFLPGYVEYWLWLGKGISFPNGLFAMGIMEYEGELIQWAVSEHNPRKLHGQDNYIVRISSRQGSYGSLYLPFQNRKRGNGLSLLCHIHLK